MSSFTKEINFVKQKDNPNNNEDTSVISNSTNNSFSDTIIQDLLKMKNIFLITKNFESKIPDILSYLQNDSNLANNKITILKYIQSLFINVNFNIEIFLRKSSNDKEKLNLIQIIIYQYILYTNSGNTKKDEDNYRSELLSLFIMLLSQVTIERETYHYILSFLINYANEKNNYLCNYNKVYLTNNPNDIPDENIYGTIKAEHLSRLLLLLQNFYKYIQSYNEPSNYFFFNGDSDSSIIITNKENPKEENKKLLNLEETLCVMLFIKLVPSDYIKAIFPKVIFRLLELRFNDRNKNSIQVNIDRDNNLTTNYSQNPLEKLSENEMNCIVVKFKKKKKLFVEIFVGNKKIEVPIEEKEKSEKSKDKDKDKIKEEIKEIILFKNFIGYCSNILIYKEKKNETLPKFLLPDEEKNFRTSLIHPLTDDSRKLIFTSTNKLNFPNGIYNEELYSNFIKAELREQVEWDILDKNCPLVKNKINENDLKDFLSNNLIAIYMPTRVEIPLIHDDKNILTTPQLILKDSINHLDADFTTRTPGLNGVHTFTRIIDDFRIIGGINNLLPIIEIMTNNTELLNNENLSQFFCLITYYVFSPQYQEALLKEKNSNFFLHLSYFLEKIPDCFFDRQLSGNFKTISSFLVSDMDTEFLELNQQFHNHILMNERILYKFKYEEQKSILEQITEIIKSSDSDKKTLDIDIIKIIKILLYYDRKRLNKFCCIKHAECFKDNDNNNNDEEYQIMEPELNILIQPVEQLIEIILDKKNNENKIMQIVNKEKNNGLHYLTELLTFDISPCLQKSIFCIFSNYIKKDGENFVDKDNEVLNISLFIYKTSIFDVKIDALNLIFLIANNKSNKTFDDDERNEFIINNILPFLLIEEVDINEKNENTEENKKNIDEKDKNEEESQPNKNIINDNTNKQEDNSKNIQDSKEEVEKTADTKNEDNKIIKTDNNNNNNNSQNITSTPEETKKVNNQDNPLDRLSFIIINNTNANKIESSKKEEEEKTKKKDSQSVPETNKEQGQEKENINLSQINSLYDENDNLCIDENKNLSINKNEEENEIEDIKNPNIPEYGIKKTLLKNKNKYSLQLLSKTQLKIRSIYNKKKTSKIIADLYELVQKIFFEEGTSLSLSLNLLVKIVSKGDLILIDSFISKILKEVQNKTNDNIYKELINNQNFFHWLIETTFQANMIKNSNLNDEKFFPGFSIDIYKNTNILEDKYIPYENKEKMCFIDNIVDCGNKIIKIIINENIYRMDYLLTWSRYYLEIKNDNNNFEYVTFFINEIIKDSALLNSKEITIPDIINNHKQKATIYIFNLLFELYTYYKLKYKPLFFNGEKNKINHRIANDLKYIPLIQNKEDETNNNKNNKNIIKLDPKKEFESLENKFDNFILFHTVYIMFTPLWRGDNKKCPSKENEIYNKYINGKKNIYVDELELLFYSFSDIEIFKDIDIKNTYCNKGIPLVLALYHYFISIHHIGGKLNEYIEMCEDFRHFLIILIISSTTLNIPSIAKKKKFLDESQFKIIQETTEVILFNSLFFYFCKIKENKKKILECQQKEKENNNEKEYLDILIQVNKMMIENLGFLLKLLNKIYRGVEKEKKGFLSFWKMSNADSVKRTGVYKVILNMYNESSTLNNNINNNNLENDFYLRKSTDIKKVNTISEKDLIIAPSSSINDNKKDKKLRESETIRAKGKLSLNEEFDINNKKILRNTILLSHKGNETNNNSNINNSNNNNNINTTNYLDELSQINFFSKDSNSLYSKIEEYINIFLNDKEIEDFFFHHKNDHFDILFPFKTYIKKRQELIGNIIPIYDNRKYISPKEYPISLCLVPNYFIENNYESSLMKTIEQKNKELNEELQFNQKKWQMEDHFKGKSYNKSKKKLFSFSGIWSTKEYFYQQTKYKLKYKLLNHLTDDYTRVFLTPIIDIDYYLPKFSMFNGEIFRSIDTTIPICKIADLCFENKNIKKSKMNLKSSTNPDILSIGKNESCKNFSSKELQLKSEKLETSLGSFQSFDSLNNSNSLIYLSSETKINPLYELKQDNYPFLNVNDKEKEQEESNYLHEHFFYEFIKKKHSKNLTGKNFIEVDACLIKIHLHIRGIIYLNDKEIGFYSFEKKRKSNEEDYDSDRKVCFGSVFLPQKEKYNHYYINIPFDQIEFVLKRRYYFKKQALEIFSTNKKSFLFRISEDKIKTFYDELRLYLKPNIEDIYIEYNKFDEKIGFINKKNIFFNYNPLFCMKKGMNLRSLYDKWTKWEISTLKILMIMNIYANRSYNDINQYPVFPWIITDYSSNKLPSFDTPNFIRPTNLPMGMMDFTPEAKERKENYIDHWKSNEQDEDKEENYDRYGSHYSTSLYLTYYLVRVFPFSFIRLELQGKKFDDPNRLFNSLEGSFECALTQKSDVRELIPEFFCFPELFYNMNDLNLGEIADKNTKKNKLVQDIELPNWANGDGYIFIKKHRELLESPEISEKINEWFNLIFGYKQKGKEAKKCYNYFSKQTYEDFEENYNKASETEKIYLKRMVEFGVTPHQLFKGDTNKRQNYRDMKKKHPLLFNISNKIGKKEDVWDIKEELVIQETDYCVEGAPYKIFSFLKKKMDSKSEKIYFLTQDKIKIISKTNNGNYDKKTNKDNKDKNNLSNLSNLSNTSDKSKIKDNKNNKEKNEKEKNKSINNIINDTSQEKDNNETDNDNGNSIDIDESKEEEEEYKEQSQNQETISKYEKIISSPKYRMNKNEAPTIIYDKGAYIALAGFWNGHILINKLEENFSTKEIGQKNKKQKNLMIYSTNDLSPITHMIIDITEAFVLCANLIGEVYIFRINPSNKGEWSEYKVIHDYGDEISSIALNESLNIFITCYKDGYCFLYTLPECKLFNSFDLRERISSSNNNSINSNINNNNLASLSNNNISNKHFNIYANIVFISQSPLPCFVFYIRTRKTLCLYSINLHFLKEKILGYVIESNEVIKYTDFLNKDYLFIFNNIENTIDVYDISDLNMIARSSKINYSFIDFHLTSELEHVYILAKSENRKNDTNYKILVLKAPDN